MPPAATSLTICGFCTAAFVDMSPSDHYLSSQAHPQCAICIIGFADLVAYNVHMICVHGFIVCGNCPSFFGTTLALQLHYQDYPTHAPDIIVAPSHPTSMRPEAMQPPEESDDDSTSSDSESDGASQDVPEAIVETHEKTRPRVFRKALSETNVGDLEVEPEADELVIRWQQYSSPVDASPALLPAPGPLQDDFDDTCLELDPMLYDTSTSHQVPNENDQDAPLTYQRFRCPVCDESYYTLEVLSAHMWANGHGRFGSVDPTRGHRRGVSASHTAALAPASIAFTSTLARQTVSGVSNSSATLRIANAPSGSVLSVATTLRVPASGTASAMAAAPNTTLPARPSITPCPSTSAAAMESPPVQNGHVQMQQHMSTCFGQSQTPPPGKKPTGTEEYLKEPLPMETCPAPSQTSITRAAPPSAGAGPPVFPKAILIEQPEVASDVEAAVKSEAKPDDSIDTVTLINLEVKIVPNETIEIEQPAGSPVEGAVATVHLATTLSDEFEILEDISREDPESVNVVAQVDSQLNEPPTASVASFGLGIDPEAEITSVASSEIVSVVSLEDLPQTTQVSIPSYSVRDSTRGSGEGSSSAPELEQLSHSPPVEPEPRTVLPHSDVCTRGSTRVPSPFPCALSSDLNRLGSPPPSPPMMDASEVSSTFADTATMSMHRVSSYLGNTRHGVPTTAESIPQPQPAGPLPRAPPAGPSWHCRSCGKDPCDKPTATACGHIFCHQCIVKEIAETMQCPVCRKMFLLKLHVD
ncbi:hypothetical protein FOMPIDRAFT_1052717 [Fomitopsis schrenkii]|uniref:RING-type domain-containing protein n=1 Tax=Fomitopsis schrenkii TaxID=2126942 RepID=S8DWM3_FOMSC|nr:hypothetical protein FOMPIDRAFT_1052717 [Fomitopsis schrenkii]